MPDEKNTEPHYLIIAPTPPPAGGARVLGQQILDFLSEQEISFTHIDLVHSKNPFVRFCRYAQVVKQILLGARQASAIVLLATSVVAFRVGPVVWLASRMYGSKSVIRLFGGRFDLSYETLSGWQSWLFHRTILGMDLLLFETKMMVEYFRKLTPMKVEWHANSRELKTSQMTDDRPSVARSFVYLGHVRPCKGVRHIIEAAKRLPAEITIDVYGPLRDGMTADEFDGIDGLTFCGEIPNESVFETLAKYDAFLLPTTWVTEGYPGVVFEAYGAGLPVVATRWNALPEIIEDYKSGILIEPDRTEELIEAIERLSSEDGLVTTLRQGALEKLKEFDNEEWNRKFHEFIVDISTETPKLSLNDDV